MYSFLPGVTSVLPPYFFSALVEIRLHWLNFLFLTLSGTLIFSFYSQFSLSDGGSDATDTTEADFDQDVGFLISSAHRNRTTGYRTFCCCSPRGLVLLLFLLGDISFRRPIVRKMRTYIAGGLAFECSHFNCCFNTY